MDESKEVLEKAQAGEGEEVVEDDPIAVRLAKREALIKEGIDPYGHAFSYSHHIQELRDQYASLEDGATTDDKVCVAGRIMAKRDQGKIVFLVVRDSTAEIQLFCRINSLGDTIFETLKELDVGDWIGAWGTIMRTRRGELSIALEAFELLSKSLRPLPEKFHGLADKETRYRQRYVDLIMNPEVRTTFEARFKIVSAIRRYMDDQGYFEAETPVLQAILGGANAKPFITHHNALDRDFYLRIATELPLKRLLVGGFEKVYEIGRLFRNEGIDHYHNPEFTTMEAYQAFSDREGIAALTQNVIQKAAQAACNTLQISYQGIEIDLSGEWPRKTMLELINEQTSEQVDFSLTREELSTIAQQYGVKVEKAWGKGKIIGELFEATAEANIIQPTFVTEHPTEISPLAKKKAGDENVTDRFELFIAGHEYANGFSELNDPVDQAQRFQAQVEAKATGDEEAMGYDDDYVRALEYGMPPAGGVGIGIDRLVMLLTDSESVRDVLLFPHMREEVK